jgi:integrase
VKQVAPLYLASLTTNPELAESYTDKVRLNLELHILPEFSARRLESITRPELEAFKLRLLDKERMRSGGKLKPRTVKDILRCFHGLFVYAHAHDLISRVPAFPKAPKVARTLPTFLDFDEEKRLYAAIESPRERLLVMFAIRTGVRAGEHIALQVRDLDLANRKLYVRRAWKRAKVKASIGKPKSGSERYVDIDVELTALLREHAAGLTQPEQFVFTRPDGQMLDHDYLDWVLGRALAAAGITKHVRWHDLRHTFGSHRAMLGADVIQIRDWMGHASVKTTEIYMHLAPSRGRQAVDEMQAKRAEMSATPTEHVASCE